MKTDTDFWTKRAAKYAAKPIADMQAYAQTLDRIKAHMPAGARVLELGCGTGATALRLAPHAGQILATDFAEGMIAQARARPPVENVRFAVADVFDDSLRPGSFDVILALNVLHLMPDVPQVYARIQELLASGGLLISKTPCIGEADLGLKFNLLRKAIPFMQWAGMAPYVRFLTCDGLQDEIGAAGFRIVETGSYPRRPPNHFVVARAV